MKYIFTLSFIVLSCHFAFGQREISGHKNAFIEAAKIYKQDPYLFTGTVYGIYLLPIGSYKQDNKNRGWGVGIENRISLLRWQSAVKPIYSINTTVNRWKNNGSLGTDIILSGQAGLNYIFPTRNQRIKTYIQGLLGVGAAGSYLSKDNGYAEEINHQGIGPMGSLGTGIYFSRFHVGLTCNLFNVTLKNVTEVNKNMNSLHIRVGARI